MKLFEHFLHFLMLNDHSTINTLRKENSEKKRVRNKKVQNLLVQI